MVNNSSTGGYLLPNPEFPTLPQSLTLKQFLQVALVGISGLDGVFVRPKWQREPPKQPDIDINWMAFAVTQSNPDANAYTGLKEDDTAILQRHETLEIQCSFYGPDCEDLASLVRDGFQIQQNLEGFRFANMGFVSVSQAIHLPELVHERWIDRVEMSIYLRREIQRAYPVLFFASAGGTIKTVLPSGPYSFAWLAES